MVNPIVRAFISALILFFAIAGVIATEQTNTKTIKVGFLAVGPVNDNGFNYADNQGRLFLEKAMPGQVQTVIAERIPESAEAERVLEKMIAQGTKLIFTVSYGYLEPALKVATRHPDATFMQINRFQTAKNLGTFHSPQYQPMYLAGMVAGHMTKHNKLGFIGAHPVPPLLQAINAFTIGARSVNPKVETQVVWINSWSDPTLEAESVKGLVESGCDVIAHAQDTQNTVLPTCESLGVYSCGFYTDGNRLAPKGWLTGACLDWGPFFVKITKQVMNHTWKPVAYTSGMEDGYVKLSSFGKVVPESVRKEVLAKEKDIKTGKFVIFQGPMKDRDGNERIGPGQKPDLKQLAEMNWFVPGVHGALPKK
jgi:basic membrane protein A